MCTLDRSYSESHHRWAGPGDRQGGWWLSLPLGIFNGRVAERQVAEHNYSQKCYIFCGSLLAILPTQILAKILHKNFRETDLCLGQVEEDEDKEEAQKDGEGQKCIFLNRDCSACQVV